MNENFDSVEKRLKNADPAKGFAALDDTVVTQAMQQQPKFKPLSFKALRRSLAGGAVATASVAIVVAMISTQSSPLITLGNDQRASMAGSDAAAESSMVADDFWGYYQYEYIAADSLSEDSGRGTVYQLVLEGDPVAKLKEVAEVFGVAGEPVRDQWSTAENPSYSIDTDDAYLSIWWNGTGQFNYSSKSDWLADECYQVREEPMPVDEEIDGGGSSSSDAAEPEVLLPDYCENELTPTPELIPDAAEIEATALRLFAATGFTPEASSLRINRDQWGANAMASLVIDGQDTAIEWYVGWNQNGTLSYFGGHSATISSRGEFNTVSAKEAVTRLESGYWFGSPASSTYQDARIFTSEDVAVESETIESGAGESGTGSNESGEAESTPETAGGSVATDTDTTEPAPGQAPDQVVEEDVITDQPITDEPAPDMLPVEPGFPIDAEAELVRITITEAESALLLIYDASGGAWLVPGYLLYQSEGWSNPVISLEEGVIELPRYDEVGTMETDIGN